MIIEGRIFDDLFRPVASAPVCGFPGLEAELKSPCGSKPTCAPDSSAQAEVAEARAYLLATATPGYTMMMQGPELAIERLHPEFVVRLANAIREARGAGLPFAGIFSAYRPPAFGIGGFADKFQSLHTYGLAVDMHGIGGPGSAEAQLWHHIAAGNGIVCPYGPRNRAEWNHCQPTSVKKVLAENPLRQTVSAAGPFDLESMFEAGEPLIEDMASAADSVFEPEATSSHAAEAGANGSNTSERLVSRRKTKPNPATRHVADTAKRDAKVRPRAEAGKKRIVEQTARKSKPGRA
jgi:hypothetical protein